MLPKYETDSTSGIQALFTNDLHNLWQKETNIIHRVTESRNKKTGAFTPA